MVLGRAASLGVSLFDSTPPVEWVAGGSNEDQETLIRAAYRQILGNAYIMESERLKIPESRLKRNEISVREFVRQIAKSDLYRSRFFTNVPRYRAIELNFRHFLGRTPINLEEMRTHSTILDTAGYEAEIDSYLDSDEYQNTFGENFVPYIRGWKTESIQNMVQFTHLFEMVRGASSSSLKGSLSGKEPRLNSLVIQSIPTAVVSPASDGASFRTPPGSPSSRRIAGSVGGSKTFRIEVTGYSANTVGRVSKFRRSNQVLFVPFERLSEEYQRIHKAGGVIASITPL